MSLPRLTIALVLLHSMAAAAQQPQPILLWPNGAPGSEGKRGDEIVRLTEQGEHIISRVHHPSITPYLPAADFATGAAVIVIPGGGHRELWMDHEGYRVGQWLSDHGVAAFVLKYRLAREEGSTYSVEGDALADVQRAIRLVRSKAAAWHITADRIGVLGFSAGGELAALAGTRSESRKGSADPVDRESASAQFMGLIYPSIPPGLSFSKDTPPVFLLCGTDDSPAIAEGVPALYAAVRRAGGSAELHILAGVGHGFGIRDSNPRAVAGWPGLFYDWLESRGMLASPAPVAQLTPQVRDGIVGARPVPIYSVTERADAARKALGLAALPTLGTPVSLTPDAPYGRDGAHLSIWKPAFVLGTSSGGEAGINFWGIHNEGHVNVGFTPNVVGSWLLDCRLLSAGKISYKIYGGEKESLKSQGLRALIDNHFLLLVPATAPGEVVSVELWPTPVNEPMGFLGCELGRLEGAAP